MTQDHSGVCLGIGSVNFGTIHAAGMPANIAPVPVLQSATCANYALGPYGQKNSPSMNVA